MRAADALDYHGLAPTAEYRRSPTKMAAELRAMASDLWGEPAIDAQALEAAAITAADALDAFVASAEAVLP